MIPFGYNFLLETHLQPYNFVLNTHLQLIGLTLGGSSTHSKCD